MKRIVILLSALILSTAAFANFNYESYKPSTIKEAIDTLNPELVKLDWFFEAAHTKFKVTVTYTGKHRNTDQKSVEFLKNWVKAFNHPPQYAEMFPFEIEVFENGKKYWLPLQGGLVKDFAEETQENTKVDLYVMLIGGYKNYPILAINAFQVNETNNTLQPTQKPRG